MALITTLLVTCLIHSRYVTGLNVSFALEERAVNEVIFVEEKDIVIRCHAIGLSGEFIMRIYHEGKGEIARTKSKNCLEYTIEQVSSSDNGTYTCNVSYTGERGSIETEAQTLQMNVQVSGPQCFRNGTKGVAYQNGDLILMSCYCLVEMQGCFWLSTVPGSRNGERLDHNKTNHHSKYILRVLIRHNSNTSKTRYDCANGYSRGCSIGPENESSKDMIINTPQHYTRMELPECWWLSTAEPLIDTTEHFIPTQTMLSGNNSFRTGLYFMIVGTTGGVLIFFVIILIASAVCIIYRKRSEVEKSRSVRRLVQKFRDDGAYSDETHSLDSTSQNQNDNPQGIEFTEVWCGNKSTSREVPHLDPDLPSSGNVIKSIVSTGDYAELDERIFPQSLQNGNDLNQITSQNDVTPDEMLRDDYTSVSRETLANEQDNCDTLYAKVDKYRQKEKKKQVYLEHNKASSEEASSTYAKVEKNEGNSRSEVSDDIKSENEEVSKIYAEISKAE